MSPKLGAMPVRCEMREYPGLFRACDAESRGITQYGLRFDSRFRAVITGVHQDQREIAEHPTPLWAESGWMDESLKLRAVSLVIPNVAGGYLTAARLFGLPLPFRLRGSRLHLVTQDAGKRLERQDMTLHRRRRADPRMWCDLPLCSPVEVFIDLAGYLNLEELVAAGDGIVGNWHGPPLCPLSYLRRMIVERRYLRQREKIMRSLSLIRESVDSPQETGLRLWCIGRGLPEPVVHPQIYCSMAARVIEPDLGLPTAKLALEYEGDHHRTSKDQWDSDIRRDEALRREGWTVLRVTSRTDRNELERKIRAHLQQGNR